MESAQPQNPEIPKLMKVRGDLPGDIALLDKLLPYINGRLKYSVECPPTDALLSSFVAYPGDLIDVQTEMRVEILIDYHPGHHLLVYFHPLNMLLAREDPDLAALEISHASRLVQFHLWTVERDLYYGRSFPNLKRSMGNYLLGCCPAFVAWNQGLGVEGAGVNQVVVTFATVAKGGVQTRGQKQTTLLESDESNQESFEETEEESFEEVDDSGEEELDAGAVEERDEEEYIDKGRRRSTRRK